MFFGMNPTTGAAFTMKALIVVVMGGIGFLIVPYFVTVGAPLTAAARFAAGSLF